MTDNYVLGQGKVFFDEINLTTKLAIGKGRFIGNVPEDGFIISPAVQEQDHFESYTGYNRKDARIETQQMATITVRMEDINKDNLAIAMFGVSATIPPGSVTNETKIAHKGFSFHLDRINLTSFTTLALGEAPATVYVNGTDYVVDLKTGEVFIPSTSTIPDATEVKASYVAGAMARTTGFSALNKELWVRFNGKNMAAGLSPVVAEAFKVRFKPASTLDFIKNAFPSMQLELTGEILFEPALENVLGYQGGMYRVLTV